MAKVHDGPVLKLVHLDDDPFELDRVRKALQESPVECQYEVTSVGDEEAFKTAVKKVKPDAVLLDIHLDEGTKGEARGVALAGVTKELAPEAVVLMCSTADDVSTIASCLQIGADDFISKQSDRGELSLRILNSYRLAKLKAGTGGDAGSASQANKPVGATMERLGKRVPLIIDSAITSIFIRGESGTGKEVVADLFGEFLSQPGPGNPPFVRVNCGAIAPTLLASELFGHVKGAFTGATSDKRGLFEAASGGWIFLDEVATLSGPAQVSLLRVLENQELMRVGSNKATKIKVRVLAATNEPMEKLVADGEFRGDLWQRLREAEIGLPPLRERPDEIPALVEHFCSTMNGGPYKVSGPVMEVLTALSYKEGNIRELRNVLRAMTEMHVNKLLTPLAIPERVWEELGEKPAAGGDDGQAAAKSDVSPEACEIRLAWQDGESPSYDVLADRLLLELTRTLAAQQGKLSLRGLAATIGMSRSTLSGRLKALVHKNIVAIEELAKLVGITETSASKS